MVDYENLVLTDTQTVGDMAVYWLGTRTDTRQFGICFDGPVFNIARQSIAESVVLAFAMFADALDEIPRITKVTGVLDESTRASAEADGHSNFGLM